MCLKTRWPHESLNATTQAVFMGPVNLERIILLHFSDILFLQRWNTCTKLLQMYIQLFVAPSTAARQAPLSMWFSGQEYWSGLPCPPPGDLPDPGIISASPALAGRFFTTTATLEAHKDGTALAKSCTKTKFLLPVNSRPLIFLRRNSRMNEKSKYEERKKRNNEIKRHK